MLKTLTAWNKVQFEEYSKKSNRNIKDSECNNYRNNLNDSFFFKDLSSLNPNPFKKSIESFYSLPGIPLSDTSPIANESLEDNVEQRKDERHRLRNKSHVLTDLVKRKEDSKLATLNCYSSLRLQKKNSNNTAEWCSTILDKKDIENKDKIVKFYPNNPISYEIATKNLKSFLDKRKSSGDNPTASSFKVYQRKNQSKSDKSIQTFTYDPKKVRVKNKSKDRSSQTNGIKTKNRSMSTDFKFSSDLKRYCTDVNERKTPRNDKKKSSKSKIDKSTKLCDSLDFNSTSQLKKPNIVYLKKEKLYSEYKLNLKKPKIGKKSNSLSPSDSKDSDSERKFKDVTVSSDSKITPILLPFEKININLKNSTNTLKNKIPNKSICLSKKDNIKGTSFWDDLLIKSVLETVHPVSDDKRKKKEESENKISDEHKDANIKCGKFGDVSLDTYYEIDSKEKKKTIIKKPTSSPLLIKPEGTKPLKYIFSNESKLSKLSSKFNSARIYYLKPHDELIKSYLNTTDRRIKSVSTKNGCSITILGPLQPQGNRMLEPTFVYRCTISSNNPENIDKCINYLKETFPNSYLQNSVKTILK